MKGIGKKCALIATAAVFFLGGCAGKVSLLSQGEDDLKSASYDDAVEKFELFIEQQEELAVKGPEDQERKKRNLKEAYLGTGIARFEQKRYEEAEVAFKEAINEGKSNTPMLCRFIGLCLMEQGKYEEALDYFSQGVMLPLEEPEQAKGHGENDTEVVREMRLLMIDCCEKLRDWKGADKAAKRYLEEYPDDAAVKKEEEFLNTR